MVHELIGLQIETDIVIPCWWYLTADISFEIIAMIIWLSSVYIYCFWVEYRPRYMRERTIDQLPHPPDWYDWKNVSNNLMIWLLVILQFIYSGDVATLKCFRYKESSHKVLPAMLHTGIFCPHGTNVAPYYQIRCGETRLIGIIPGQSNQKQSKLRTLLPYMGRNMVQCGQNLPLCHASRKQLLWYPISRWFS